MSIASPHNLCVYLGSGEKGRKRRERYEDEARKNGYITKKGRVRLAAYIVDRLDQGIKPRTKS